jgi:Na+:H+ antiporter
MNFFSRRQILILLILALTAFIARPYLSDAFASEEPASTHSEAVVEHTSEEMAVENGEGHGEADGHGGGGGGHADTTFLFLLLSWILVLMAGKAGGEIAERISQPAVLGELIIGIIIGNLALIGFYKLDYLKTDEYVNILAEIGVILLLFEVGLESNLGEMMEVGLSSLLVAVLGVIVPFFLGLGVSYYFLPDHNFMVYIFIGATLTATSVGITARVLKDMGKLEAKESRIILGAAVIDDILGLIVLAIVVGVIGAANDPSGDSISIGRILGIIGKAIGFLVVAAVIGRLVFAHLYKFASFLRVHGMLLITSLSICFVLSACAGLIGLAPIVGAFAAGLILDKVHYRDFTNRGEHKLEELVSPVSSILTPVFFVIMGIKVDLTTFADPSILVFAGVLTLVAIVGKQICSLGVLEKGLNRLAVGVGMIPRGEVGLIFANIGAGLYIKGEKVITTSTFSAVVIMVVITTVVTPPILKKMMMDKKK